MSFRPYDPAGEHGRLLAIVERLHDAIATRDAALVQAMLDARSATSIPRDVRAEALAIVTLPAASYRVPMQLLQFHHRLTELARSEDGDSADFRRFEAADALGAEDDDAFWEEELVERADGPPAPDPDQLPIPFKGSPWSGSAHSGRSEHRSRESG